MVKSQKNKIVYEENINNIKGKALAVIFPETMQEIKSLIKTTEEDIIFRGNGTSFTGAVIPKNSFVVDFSKMNNILEINEARKIVVVEPGVLLDELNEELEPYGLEFPIIPIFAGLETLGGMIAKNSAGNREIKYSRMINWIDSLEVINGKGEQIKISKSDLSDFVGLEGTTGAIVKASLRLTTKKRRSLTILKANTLQDVFMANRKLKLKQDISSIDMINPFLSSILGLDKKYHLFVESESEEGNFRAENYEHFMKLKNSAYKRAASEGFIYMSNIKFLIDSLQDFLLYLEEKSIPYFSHMASGVVYPLFKLEQVNEVNEAMKFAKRIRGKIAYNFGIGLTKKDSLEPGEIHLIKRVKSRHDPHWKLNKDKLIDFKIMNKPDREIPREILEPEKPEIREILEIKEQTELMEEPKQEQISVKKQEPELSLEEKEKIKKIAAGFFAGGRNGDNN